MSDEDPTQLMRDLRGMTGFNHVGRVSHDAVEELLRLRKKFADIHTDICDGMLNAALSKAHDEATRED